MVHWVWKAHYWGFAIEYEEPVAEGFKLISMVLKMPRDLSMAYHPSTSGHGFEAVAGYKYGLASKYKWDGLAIVIFWKVIDVLDEFHVNLYGVSFLENSYLL